MTVTRSVPWLRVLGEGVVIVGSIPLAFGIDAWWDERGDRVRETEHLLALRNELVQNVERLEALSPGQEIPIEAQGGGPSSHPWRGARTVGGLLEQPGYQILALLAIRAGQGAYDALISSGDIGLIESDTIVGQLSAWMGDFANGFEEEDLSTLYRVELTRAIAKHVDLSSFFLPAPPEYSVLEDLVAQPASLRTLPADREFSSLLSALRGTELQVLFWMGGLRDQASLAIDLIDQELAN